MEPVDSHAFLFQLGFLNIATDHAVIFVLIMLSSLSILSEVFLTGKHAAETYGNLIMEFISRLA